MKLTSDQKCWVISIGVHAVIWLVLAINLPVKSMDAPSIVVPVNVSIIKAKEQKKVASKQLVSKKAAPRAKQKSVPTSLPGDRIQPAIAKRSAPTYPKKALNNDWEGTVKVKVTVSNKGVPIAIKVLASSGHSVLDQSFIRSIKKNYRFNPKRKMGKDQVGTMVLTHTFSLKAST